MDLIFFLRDRNQFVLRYYRAAAGPFEDTKRKIDASESPFDAFGSDDGIPPYLAEWSDAASSLLVLGAHCISMLSDSVRLFLEESNRKYHLRCEGRPKRQGHRSILDVYRECISRRFSPNWATNPADMRIVEQIVLARNAVQNPDYIHTVIPEYRKSDVAQHGLPFFIGDHERAMLDGEDLSDLSFLLLPTLRVDYERLTQACEQVELFAEWLDGVMSSE